MVLLLANYISNMPELPEVEALRRSLEPYVISQKIDFVKVLLPKLVSSSGTTRKVDLEKLERFKLGLQGRELVDLRRRSKNLIFSLSDGGRLLIHLKMSGQLVYQGKGKRPETEKILKTDQRFLNQDFVWGGHPIELTEHELPNKHTHLIFNLDRGNLFYNDVRQFGYLLYYSSMEELDLSGHFAGLGMEPLSDEFTLKNFTIELQKKKGNLKKLFLDQKVVVGLGNIYADEVCFVAGVRPTRNVETLKTKEIKRIYEAIRQILPVAIEDGGSSVASYLLGDGTKGNYAKKHFVYNRGGQCCKVCGAKLIKTKIAGRTTVYCPVCQK